MPTTPNFGWTQPTVGGSGGTWGTEQNALTTAVDSDLFIVKTTADNALPKAGGVLTGEVEVFTERYLTVDKGATMTGAQTLDPSTANYFFGTATGAITFTISPWPASGKFASILFECANLGAFSHTFPAAVKWDGGSEPTFQTSGTDIISFSTRDNGTTIRAELVWSGAT